MTFQRKIKDNALLSLKNHWGRALAVLLFQAGVYSLVILLEQILCEILEFTSPDRPALMWNLGMGLWIDSRLALLTAASALIVVVILSPIEIGVKHWFYEQATGRQPSILTIFSYFYSWKVLFRAILLRLAVWGRKLLWAVLFLVPTLLIGAMLHYIQAVTGMLLFLQLTTMVLWGFLAVLMWVLWYFFTLRYQLADYLFICDNTRGIHEIIRSSVQMMKHGKRQLFSLKLSMLPWGILSLLTVPAIFTVPYYTASMALFSAVRIENWRRRTTEK